ncbi:serine/threonine protein kinase [Couchioplanes caeruleus]|uniref:serine/threonine-protein kinase n=1 Tax=Couchioplanes caeruleus TaxID=56438 RepID=UPI0020BDAAC2|nr:serine/threonine-protein kinase [Couchioplanes caeruleus]UQU63403.1 serine/threonine protein kinase [Couchioplanes caeruleus]
MARLPMGTAILRRYVLIGAIGQGGVSTVYRAVDSVRGRKLAVKILAPTLAGDPGARDDVRREALITDRLRHPSVPRVFEYGDAPLPDGTVVPYVALELLDGVPLTERLAGGRLEWPEAVRIAATAADVLAVAHRRGVVHRDLSARNVMLATDGVKIIDFGLATATRPGDGITESPALPYFRTVAPGRDRGAPPSHPKTAFARPADDVYTLGVLLYEMLTGRSPYPPAVAATIVAAGRAAHLAPTPVLAIPGLPPRLRDLVRACMAKRPEDRPASVDVALDLWRLLDEARPLEPSVN